MQHNVLNLHKHSIRLAEFHCELKEVDTEKRLIRGFASTPAIDKYADIVDPNSFKGTIAEFMKRGKILAHHNARTPVGNPTDYELSDKGLWIEASLAQGIDTLDHKEQTWNDVVQRLLEGLSIGFRIVKDEAVDPNSEEGKRGAQRKITKLRLFEISVVTIPAGEGTWFSVSKGLQFGSDAPFDVYRRNLWPDLETITQRKDALDLYWSGQWPDESVRALHTVDAPQVAADTNEGVTSESVSALRLRTASLAARRQGSVR